MRFRRPAGASHCSLGNDRVGEITQHARRLRDNFIHRCLRLHKATTLLVSYRRGPWLSRELERGILRVK